mmetsp:Transcript_57582/g.137139  ORF Transcript_57582/g.137139 Transcript_57582/m.137139 type:complete len:210 (-) Transcript_57582:6207-6836(-)
MSCLASSLVTWSPHLFTIGMEASSMNTVIFLPPGGQNVLPVFLSISPSMLFWNPKGWVALLKFRRLDSITSWEKRLVYISAVDVFAVPGAPTIMQDLKAGGVLVTSCLAMMSKMYSARTESMVGISRAEKFRILGGFHSSGSHFFQGLVLSVQSGTHSKMVWPSSQGGIASLCLASSKISWNLDQITFRGSGSNRPPKPHMMHQAKMRR